MEERDESIADASVSTEEKIKLAASKVFTRKGFSETTTRDIATVAGIPLGSLHYYYRTKEKLFQVVSQEAMQEFAKIMDEIFRDDIPLREKIHQFVHRHIDFFIEKPFIPSFCISESERAPDNLYSIVDFRSVDERLRQELEKAAAEGIIRPITIEDFMVNLVSMTIFPFLAKNMIKYSADLTEAQYDEMLERRKALIPDMMIKYLFLE